MMKFKSIVVMCLVSTVLLCCIVHKKKDDYVIPDTVPVEVRDEVRRNIEAGKVLYKQYCTGCHGIFEKGKDGVPNFTDQELHKYSERYIMKDPTNHAVAFQMDLSQLQYVLTYLRYHIVKNGGKDIPGGL